MGLNMMGMTINIFFFFYFSCYRGKLDYGEGKPGQSETETDPFVKPIVIETQRGRQSRYRFYKWEMKSHPIRTAL